MTRRLLKRAAVVLLLAAIPGAWAKPRLDSHDPYPQAAVAYATVIDGEMVWGRNVDVPRAPASLTKLLTALVILNGDWDPDAWLTTSHDAAHTTHPRAGLHTGDRVRAYDALQAMLMHSANDACLVLAENAAGSIEAFSRRMNTMAAQLGMSHSHFVHPCGFDEDGQYSTVTDLLRLAKSAHADPRIARIVRQKEAEIAVQSGRKLSFHNTNQLLGHMEGVMGLKTGYTAQAGRCLIAVAEQSGHRVWLVLLDSQRRWTSANRILTDAFSVAGRDARLRTTAYVSHIGH
jgi:serine-type D-Ala-D-Ala carboxypeptidase (penicillin-binding protein 5/6)